MIDYCNQKMFVNKNATEIVKNVIYGEDNYMLRAKAEDELSDIINKRMMDMIDLDFIKIDNVE